MTGQRPLFGGTRRARQDVEKFAAADAYAGVADIGREFLADSLVRYFINSHEYGAERKDIPPKYRFKVTTADFKDEELLDWMKLDAPRLLSIYPSVTEENGVVRSQIIMDRGGRLTESGKVPEFNCYPSLHPGIVCMSIDTPNNNTGRLVVAAMLNELVKTGKWRPSVVTHAADRKASTTEPVTSYDQLAGYKGKAEEYEPWLKSLRPNLDLLLPAESGFLSIAANQIGSAEARELFQKYGLAVDNYVTTWSLR